MGTRLTIKKTEPEFFYGTKLYGYTGDIKKLKSFQFLIKHDYIPFDCDDVEQMPPVVMAVCDFKEWIKLYNEELKYSPYNRKDDLLKDKFISGIFEMDNFDTVLLTWG